MTSASDKISRISSETNSSYSLIRFIISALYPRSLIRERTMMTVSRTTLIMRLSDFPDGIPDIFFYFFICVFLSFFSCREVKVVEPPQPILFRMNGFSNLFFSVSGSCLMMSIRVSESISMATFGIVLSSVILKIQYQKNRDVSRGVTQCCSIPKISPKFPFDTNFF